MSTNVATLKAGSSITGIVPSTLEDVYRLAKGISASGLAPKEMSTPEQITVAILTGLEIGLPPMFAIQKIAVVNGRPTLWGDALPGILWSRGFKIREWMDGEGDARTARCEVTRPDGAKIERAFSVRDAIKAGLWSTDARVTRKSRDGGTYQKDNDSPWFRFPERMLQMRARGYACRDGAADALGGLYLREEIEEPMKDITPAKPEPLAIPDIPDELAKEPAINQDQAADVQAKKAANQPAETDDAEPIADPDGLLAKLADDIALCDSETELSEVAEQYADLIPRLPVSMQKRARKMIEDAAS